MEMIPSTVSQINGENNPNPFIKNPTKGTPRKNESDQLISVSPNTKPLLSKGTVSPKYAWEDGSNIDFPSMESTRKRKNPSGVGIIVTSNVPRLKRIIPANMPVLLPRVSAREAR
jgi:hypothetical protein